VIDQDTMARALGAVARENQQSALWEYDTIKSAKYEAKIELCEELARELCLDRRPVYLRARAGE
jgi:hypothetical protein